MYYINKFDCIVPKGYNVDDFVSSNRTSFCYYDKETFFDIINDIKENRLSFVEISEKYHISKRTVIRLNKGETHRLPNESYPLRPHFYQEKKYCIDCGKEICRKSVRCKNCS